MPTKTTGKGLQRVTSRVWYVTDPDQARRQGGGLGGGGGGGLSFYIF